MSEILSNLYFAWAVAGLLSVIVILYIVTRYLSSRKGKTGIINRLPADIDIAPKMKSMYPSSTWQELERLSEEFRR